MEFLNRSHQNINSKERAIGATNFIKKYLQSDMTSHVIGVTSILLINKFLNYFLIFMFKS